LEMNADVGVLERESSCQRVVGEADVGG